MDFRLCFGGGYLQKITSEAIAITSIKTPINGLKIIIENYLLIIKKINKNTNHNGANLLLTTISTDSVLLP